MPTYSTATHQTTTLAAEDRCLCRIFSLAFILAIQPVSQNTAPAAFTALALYDQIKYGGLGLVSGKGQD